MGRRCESGDVNIRPTFLRQVNKLVSSEVEELFFVVNSVIQLVEVPDEVLLSEGIVGLLVRPVTRLQLLVETLPLLVVVLAVLLVLLYRIDLLLGGIHAQGLLEGEGIDLL